MALQEAFFRMKICVFEGKLVLLCPDKVVVFFPFIVHIVLFDDYTIQVSTIGTRTTTGLSYDPTHSPKLHSNLILLLFHIPTMSSQRTYELCKHCVIL